MSTFEPSAESTSLRRLDRSMDRWLRRRRWAELWERVAPALLEGCGTAGLGWWAVPTVPPPVAPWEPDQDRD